MSEAGAAAARPLGGRGAETATGALAGCLVVVSFAHFGLSARGLVSAFFLAVLVLLARIDLERRILPDRIVFPAAAAVLAAQLVLFPDRALEWILAPLAAFAILFVPLLVRPNGIGFGDVKLMLLLGAALGFAVLDALLIGFLLVVPLALFLLLRDGAGARTRAIPLGPFLAGGAVLALFLG